MSHKKPLDRRTFLKGSGVALALPFMEAMLPINRSWAAEPPKFAVLYTGVGMTSDPSGSKLMHPDIRSILSPYNSYATYITGLYNDGITNNHDELPGFMAGTNGDGYGRLTTIDRVAADLLSKSTIFPSGLFVGSQTRAGQQSAIRKAMSHKTGSQSTLYHDPRVLFDLITKLGGFSGGGTPSPTPTPTPTVNNTKRDVLSLALDSIKSLKRDLSSGDKEILDRHLTAIEQIQNSMNALPPTPTSNTVAGLCAAPTVAASFPDDRGDIRLPIIADISALALNCDLTRSLAFLVFPDGSGSTAAHYHLYDELSTLGAGRPGVGYHEWTHRRWSSPSNTSNANEPRCDKAILMADKFDASIVKRFLDGLTPSTLESAVVAYGSGGSCDGSHPSSGETGYHQNLPFVLFGKMGGQIRPRGVTPLNHSGSVCNVWLTLLKNMGYTGSSFGTLRETTRTVSLG